MTLYNNFPSKEALTLAVYEGMVATDLRELRSFEPHERSEEERVLAVFRHFGSKASRTGYRGCPFIHASLQAAEPSGPIYTLVQSYKRALRDYLLGLLEGSRANREELADQIVILLDGAVTEAYLKGVEHPSKAAMRAAVILLQVKI